MLLVIWAVLMAGYGWLNYKRDGVEIGELMCGGIMLAFVLALVKSILAS